MLRLGSNLKCPCIARDYVLVGKGWLLGCYCTIEVCQHGGSPGRLLCFCSGWCWPSSRGCGEGQGRASCRGGDWGVMNANAPVRSFHRSRRAKAGSRKCFVLVLKEPQQSRIQPDALVQLMECRCSVCHGSCHAQRSLLRCFQSCLTNDCVCLFWRLGD